jgi:hypothetical protein
MTTTPSTNADDLIAYSDETGNTGNNIFDPTQPWFWSGTLLVTKDFGERDKATLAEWAEIVSDEEYRAKLTKGRLDLSELHANALGMGRIEKLAQKISDFISDKDMSFVFTRIEKVHIAPTKFADVLLDSGINKGVSSVHYNFAGLRLPLAVTLMRNLSPEKCRYFWEVYQSGNASLFRTILASVKWNILNKVSDARTQELLVDAINWANKHPDVLLEQSRSEFDAPNVIALTMLMAYLHRVHQSEGKKVTRFIHDEQNQFASTFAATYEGLRHVTMTSTPTSYLPEIAQVDTYQCPFTMSMSHAVTGLQLIDVVLWLFKRWTDRPWTDTNGCFSLVKEIETRSTVLEFSRRQLEMDAFVAEQYVLGLPISDEQLTAGMKLFQEVEESRKRRAAES